MGLLENGSGAAGKGFSSAWSVVAKPCDYCKSASAFLFCRTDSVFLCMACDSRVHGGTANKHERVWMCEVCEQAPASVTCKADAAALCVTCDRDIHSANPLSRRHERVPVVPFFDTAESVVKSTASTLLMPIADSNCTKIGAPCNFGNSVGTNTCTADSWISPNPVSSKYTTETPDLKSMEFLLSESDQLLEFDYPISIDNQFNSGSDSVVPVQTMKPPIPPQILEHPSENRFEIDFTKSSISSYSNSFPAPSLSHSVSSSSMDVGVVPDGGSMSESSYSFGRSVDLSGTASGGGGNQQASQMLGLDREARVLRYREKRKNRKFEKTIRYASRKAYAETRPRIKGRFAKRTEINLDGDELDLIFGAGLSAPGFSITDARYGVVPSFC